MFLNFKIVDFYPETIIVKDGEVIKYAYLILNGQVEGISSDNEIDVTFTPGVIIGEKATFSGLKPSYTYVAKNYVKALEIPVSFYYHFIEKNNLTSQMLNKISKRLFLLKTKIFK
jgi:CRP-like cAMP-binding protein